MLIVLFMVGIILGSTYSSRVTHWWSSAPHGPVPLLPVTLILLSTAIRLTVLDASQTKGHGIFVLCVWLISLNIVSSRSIHIAPNVRISFFVKTRKWLNNKTQLKTWQRHTNGQQVYEKKHSIREIQTKAVMRNHCTPVRMTIIKRQEIIRASEGVEKGNPCALLMELY